MTTKLHINLAQGIIDIEGDPDLVREIYADFKGHLISATISPNPPLPNSPARDESGAEEASPRSRTRPKKKALAKRRTNAEETGAVFNADSPKLDKDLDTSKLIAFYGKYEPKNHPEKILIFLTFLKEELSIESPNTDQVYTCYNRVSERIPKAFAQAFRDTSGRSFGYIEYQSPSDIRITTAGNNHFRFDLKKKDD